MSSRVSVIIPTHNRCSLLPRAVKSVLDQTYNNLECIIVDDGSTDNTKSVIKQFDADQVTVCHHKESRGASAARNTGIEIADGDYVAFLDDDDEWLPTKLEKQVNVLDEQPSSVGLVYCWLDYCNQSEGVHRKYQPTKEGYIFEEMLDKQAIGNSSTLLVRRSVAESVNGFDESLPRGNDGDFIRRIAYDYLVKCVEEVLVRVYTDHGHNRITRYDETGIRNAITGHTAKLNKFEHVLDKYPSQEANIFAKLGYLYALLGEWQTSAKYFCRAVQTAPHSISVYRNLLRSLRDYIIGARSV
jgi:glycosyltransferase involved in cell wall biosynthesis